MAEYLICIGPLTRIRIVGSICSCLLSEDDKLAKETYTSLTTLLSKGITYHKPVSSSSSSSPKQHQSKSLLGSLAAGILGTAASIAPSTDNEKWETIDAQIQFVHGFRNNIVMEIIPTTPSSNITSAGSYDETDDDDSETAALANQIPTHNVVVIPFYKIGVVSAGSNQSWGSIGSASLVILYGKQSQHNPTGKGDELARFHVPEGINRDDVVQQFSTLLSWDRRRKTAQEEKEDESEAVNAADEKGDGGKKGVLRTKAEKAAYFAKKEIEMQQRKREREQRKAKYLKEAGGLKYTAIAMANQS